MTKQCLKCNNDFKTFPCKIKDGKGKYCSKNCYDLAIVGRKLSPEHIEKIKKNHEKLKRFVCLTCKTCQIKFRLTPWIAKSNAGFCSRNCYAADLSKNAKKYKLKDRETETYRNRWYKPKTATDTWALEGNITT